ncbi:MAG: UDP-N-acetylmuramate--L-alanine ligase [Kiritimatiellia bacterium]|jgi:UDP-N-acetylmuramate--alanine ligase
MTSNSDQQLRHAAVNRYHLVGIGGVGMSALAEALLDTGAVVSGSERFLDQGHPLPVLDILRRQGARIHPQDGSGVASDLAAVVASSAIEADNPDLAAAAACGVPVVHRSQALAAALADRTLVAIAGTCGKSTITGMLGHILDVAGLDPAVVNGAPCVNWRSESRTGAVRRGSGSFCVVEVDESDRSLLNFRPAHALVSNCSADHFPLEESHALFDAFLAQVSGASLDGRHDAEPVPDIQELDWACTFTFRGSVVTLPLPGRHNAVNAWQAARMAEILGVPAEASARALASFRGISRRMELVGTRPDGVRVIDEYAHNPEKIRAALRTLQSRSARTLAIWRPHGYGPLKKMFDALVAMFAETLRPDDILFLLPVFDAGGTAARTIQSDTLRDALLEAGATCELVPDHPSLIERIDATAAPGDIIVTMGARDPDLPLTARALASPPEPQSQAASR